MKGIDDGTGARHMASKRIVVPCAPLEDDVSLRIQFLDHAASHQGRGVAAGHDLAHVHLAHVITELQDISVR